MYNPSQRFGFKQAQRGIAAIEMAITLPVLLLLLVGTAELGRAFYQYNELTKSIRAAARYLSIEATEGESKIVQLSSDKQTATRNLVVYSNTAGGGDPIVAGLDAGDVTVTQIDSRHIEVRVSFDYQPMFLRIPTFGYSASDVDTGLTLTASVTMRAL
jgi:Flp pilus assembly protein TadG